jgi:hypothetical protein
MNFTLETFLFDIPLYTKIEIDDSNFTEFESLIYTQDKRDVDGYNPFRKVQTTFQPIQLLSYASNNFVTIGGFGTFIIRCKRYGDEIRYYCLYDSTSKKLMKIGQFPSVADLHIYEIKKYTKLLPTEKLKEFTRAIGLAANGVGIGSFVYLRRIFEFLIGNAYQTGLKEKTVTESDFQRARMDEKIELLKTHLPSFLVENKEMYSVLSIGVHELDENTCLQHFDTLRVGIEIILDEQLDELRKKEKIASAQAKLKGLKSQMKK